MESSWIGKKAQHSAHRRTAASRRERFLSFSLSFGSFPFPILFLPSRTPKGHTHRVLTQSHSGRTPSGTMTQTVGRTHPQKGNHGNTYWKVLVLWKNDSNVALWRYNWRRNLSHCMFRVQRKRLPTKRTVDRLMAMGWLDICDWFYDWYVLCCSRFRRQLTPTVGRRISDKIVTQNERASADQYKKGGH